MINRMNLMDVYQELYKYFWNIGVFINSFVDNLLYYFKGGYVY